MSLESTIANLEATNESLVAEVVAVKQVSSEAKEAAIGARDRAEAAAQITEDTKQLMLARYDDFVSIAGAVAQSDSNREATNEDRLYIDQKVAHVDRQTDHVDSQVAHVDSQVAHVDSQVDHVDSQRSHIDSQRVHIDSQRVHVDNQTVQVDLDAQATAADRVQTGEDRDTTAADRARAETARAQAEALYGDLTAVENARLATAASETAAAKSAADSLSNKKATAADRTHINAQRNHVDQQAAAVDQDVATVAADKATVAADKATVAADKATVAGYRTAAQTARTQAQTANAESRAWATGTGVIANIDGTARYSAREEAQRALAERNAANASATLASQKASEALASQVAAENSESAADAHRIKASKWAAESENVEVEPGIFSAKHYMLKAREIATGSLIYMGAWKASTGTYPVTPPPARGHLYKVTADGTVGDVEYRVGDQIIFNGTSWDRVLNTESVTSVGGHVGEISDNQLLEAIKRVDGAGSGLDADTLDGLQATKIARTDIREKFDHSIGIGATPSSSKTFDNGTAIALADDDSGIRGNGDGVIELWANNQLVATASIDSFDSSKPLKESGNQVWHAGNANEMLNALPEVLVGEASADGMNALQVDGGTRTDTLAAGGVENAQESIDTDGNVQVRGEGKLKMGGFAIQFNAATQSLDFNFGG